VNFVNPVNPGAKIALKLIHVFSRNIVTITKKAKQSEREFVKYQG
jgi:hypothetical protein